ncbi:transmembrane 9 superfamily member 4-like [Trichogramma pretiosum]|uniref:transmembrane 9 superfamily member 4-like n=1 Tax=Trichogramma pretiosum TaxID=7493 RepID=UPI0006C97C65|nr:transmembrane 9 superfamily member 4-like [Trichogramma pretiosum]
MNKLKWKWAASVLVLLFIEVQSFHVPGVAAVGIKKGQKIDVKAVKMTSTHTQLPYEYYSLPFCSPENGTTCYELENLRDFFSNEEIVNTPYEVAMAQNVSCNILCHKPAEPMTWKENDSSLVIERIQHAYIIHLLIDNLPAATEKENTIVYPGYYLGGIDEKNRVYINNYLKLKLAYYKHGENEFKVVGFGVEALSVDYKQVSHDGSICKIPPQASPQYINPKDTKIQFFYSVEWEESDISWASESKVHFELYYLGHHFIPIIVSTVALIFMYRIVTSIMTKTVRRDIAKYNDGDSDSHARLEKGTIEETGWELVRGDVFRPPAYPCIFVAVIGSGIQVFCMTFMTTFSTMLGMFSLTDIAFASTFVVYPSCISGIIAGFISGRLYKSMQGKMWKTAAFLTVTLYPGIVFGTYFFFDSLWGKNLRSGEDMKMVYPVIWYIFSVPSVYCGYFFGYRKQPFTHPGKTNQIPREVPEQFWYTNPAVCTLIAGIIPFGVVFYEFFSILTAFWGNQFYYHFEVLLLVIMILAVSCSQISIIMVYIQLCKEDYRWWWRSFIVSGGPAVYMLAYSIFYFFTKSEITELAPTLMYFGYTSLMVITFWLLTGTVGFFAAYMFIRKMYASIKMD